MTKLDKKTKIALFGGAFDPPHIGHIAFCEALVKSGKFDKIWVEVSIDHPFGKQLTPLEHRLQMTQLSLEHLFDKLEIRVDEVDLGGTGYTVDLIRHLKRSYPQHQFSLVLGSDNFAVWHKWKDYQVIEELLEVKFFGRKGWDEANEALELSEPFPEVSSSELREELNLGQIPESLLNSEVVEYIKTNQLYNIC